MNILVGILIGCSNETIEQANSLGIKTDIFIYREGSLGGYFLDYNVYIEGEKVGEISNKETKIFHTSLKKESILFMYLRESKAKRLSLMYQKKILSLNLRARPKVPLE